jgi:hypothetical protein
MRFARFFFALLFGAAVFITFLKLLFFAAMAFAVVGALFFVFRAFLHLGAVRSHHRAGFPHAAYHWNFSDGPYGQPVVSLGGYAEHRDFPARPFRRAPFQPVEKQAPGRHIEVL